jgi:hypothetical protein
VADDRRRIRNEPTHGFTAMEKLKREIAQWIQDELPASPAARAAGLIAIAVVPGAWAVWLVWRLLRWRAAAL